MKSNLMVLIAVLFSGAAFGQWSVGPKVSVGTITQGTQKFKIIPNSDKIPVDLTFLGGSAVRSVGFTLCNDLGPGFLQVEVMGTKYDLEFGQDLADPRVEDKKLNETNYMVEVPVVAGFKFNDFRAGVGPILEVNVDKKTELNQIVGYKDKSKKLGGAFMGLVGYQKGIFNIDARYVYKFTGLADTFGIDDDILRLNASANRFTISAGVLFGGNKKKLVEEVIEDEVLVF